MKETDIIIIGAGCAGTSLAHHLETEGFSGKIDIYDCRTNFDREQRWCGWGELPSSFKPLVKHSWKRWTVSDEKNLITKTSDKQTYNQIYAPDFFKYFHRNWTETSSRTQIHLGEKINRIQQKQGFVEVETDTGQARAKFVFDARNTGSKNLQNLKSTTNTYLHQTFLGWKVKFPRPVFNLETATLMDFSVRQTDGLSFMYVLPYSETEGLIESTCFSEEPLEWGSHLSNIEDYLFAFFGKDYEILAEESGELPMTTAKINSKIDENIYAIGIAGGHARPSSGYAFHRIQRHTQRIAKAIVAELPIPEDFSAGKYNFFDAVFLQAIKRKPAIAHKFFLRLFSKVTPESLIRFLLDESNLSDDLKVIAALPKIEFLKAGLQSFAGRIGLKKYVEKLRPKSKGNIHDPLDSFASRTIVRDIPR